MAVLFSCYRAPPFVPGFCLLTAVFVSAYVLVWLLGYGTCSCMPLSTIIMCILNLWGFACMWWSWAYIQSECRCNLLVPDFCWRAAHGCRSHAINSIEGNSMDALRRQHKCYARHSWFKTYGYSCPKLAIAGNGHMVHRMHCALT
jgi:hypothetical protein